MRDEGSGSRREDLQLLCGHTVEEALSGPEGQRGDVGAQLVDESGGEVRTGDVMKPLRPARSHCATGPERSESVFDRMRTAYEAGIARE